MTQRFFSELQIISDEAELSGAEAHHLVHVMRCKVGDEVTLFDGSGVEFAARVVQIARNSLKLQVLSREPVNRELGFDLTLGIALPKGERQRWLVEKAVELGVTRLVPLTTERSVVRASEHSLNRLGRAVIEASKQCGRNRLMEVAQARALTDFLADTGDASERWIAHPGDEGVPTVIAKEAAVFLAVGPEGGFSGDELGAAKTHGWKAVDLGPRILRTETAGIALASLLTLGPLKQSPMPAT